MKIINDKLDKYIRGEFKMSKKLLFAVLAAMTLTVATGCGQNTEAHDINTEVVATETVTVTHKLGETEVVKNPKNVVVFELGILDALAALDVEVTGVPLSGSLPEHLSQYQDENVYTNVGSLKELDMEAIYGLEPELIIIGGRQADYYEELSEIAPTIQLAVDNTDYMASFKSNMDYVGQIFGKEAEVAEKINAVEEKVEALKEKVTEMDVTGLIALANDGEFSVYGAGSRFGIIHDTFGIKPVDETIDNTTTHGQKASFEYVVEQNPDYLFVVDRGAVTGGASSAQELFSNELMKTTDAYQNDNIVYLDASVWYTAGGGITSTEQMVDEVATGVGAFK